MLPVFVINLDRRSDRWAAMSAQLDRLGIAATRIPAIDKNTLAGDPLLHDLAPGRVACYRSHCKAMQALVVGRADAALILEDDAQVSPAILRCIRSVDWWPVTHGLIQLEANRRGRSQWLAAPVGAAPGGGVLRPIIRRRIGGCGYLIDRDAALQFLAAPAAPMPFDYQMFSLTYSRVARTLRPLQMVPGPVRHPPVPLGGSDNDPAWVAGGPPKSLRRTWWKLVSCWQVRRPGAERMVVPYA